MLLVKRKLEDFMILAVLWHGAYPARLSECPLFCGRVFSDFSISCRGALQSPLHPKILRIPLPHTGNVLQIHLLLDFPVDSGWEGSLEKYLTLP